MATRISKAPKRTGKKQYTLLSFTIEGWDGEFRFPTFNQFPVGIARKVLAGDETVLDTLAGFLERVCPESAELFGDDEDSLDFGEFMNTIFPKIASDDEPGKSEA